MDPSSAAGVENARRRIKRGAGLVLDGVRDLAALAEGVDVIGAVRAHDSGSIDAARDLVSMAVAQHRMVDVIVLARSTPTTAPVGAKETMSNGSSEATDTPAASGAGPV